ncbi:MAG: penicillin-binding protein 2 [Bacteroidetes bacterium]|nr:MAG: penicillin-binding protein 2 [Bacteroidota bacterium]REK04962.1 MAG: penicillin-binding protein 2 [Bacteroidota bacterium]REK36534.1 MAG: penicillin-binding protein 2 [Bacteroidota bacterium]REK50900.1 MAG: penicillin-binding protein 2 [Bacteroidota bacterium]
MNVSSDRKTVIFFIFLSVGIIYLMRLFYLQVIDTSYTISAQNNVIRLVTDYPSRGLIYDRKGKLLVYNEPVYDLMIIPRQAKNIDTLELCRLIGISKEDYIEKYRKARAYSAVKPSLFEKQLSVTTYATLQEKMYKFPGFYTEARTLRKYPVPMAAHLFGYIGEVDTSVTRKDPYYKDGDYIGKSGIEQSYEKYLRGKRGVRMVMVDVFNREKGSYMSGKYDTASVAGEDLTLSIDGDLQYYGEELLRNKVGSVVAIEPSTGEILCMVSSPSYDPNLLVGRERTKNYLALLKNPYKPLFNRAQMALYPPGSTFKLVMALIGQQNQLLSRETRYPCIGGYPPGGGKPKCHPHPSMLDLKASIAHSCNSYYTYIFRNVIDDKKYRNTEQAFIAWREAIAKFGIGVRLEADLPNVLRGSVPTVAYYDKYFGKNQWRSSTILSLGIGQGELGITPLQNANILAGIANRGWYITPHVVKAIGDEHYLPDQFKVKHDMGVDRKYYDVVVEGMLSVVESGTAARTRIKGIDVCGKTGTAQNPHGKDHSAYVAFAPMNNPKIAIAVMVENSGFGSQWAAPIASLMIEKYLTDSISRHDMDKRMKEGVILPEIKLPKPESTPDSIPSGNRIVAQAVKE